MTTSLTPQGTALRPLHKGSLEGHEMAFLPRPLYIYVWDAVAMREDPPWHRRFSPLFETCTVQVQDYFVALEREGRVSFPRGAAEEWYEFGFIVATVRQHPLWDDDALDDPRVTLDLKAMHPIFVFESRRTGYLFLVAVESNPDLEYLREHTRQVTYPHVVWLTQDSARRCRARLAAQQQEQE